MSRLRTPGLPCATSRVFSKTTIRPLKDEINVCGFRLCLGPTVMLHIGPPAPVTAHASLHLDSLPSHWPGNPSGQSRPDPSAQSSVRSLARSRCSRDCHIGRCTIGCIFLAVTSWGIDCISTMSRGLTGEQSLGACRIDRSTPQSPGRSASNGSAEQMRARRLTQGLCGMPTSAAVARFVRPTIETGNLQPDVCPSSASRGRR